MSQDTADRRSSAIRLRNTPEKKLLRIIENGWKILFRERPDRDLSINEEDIHLNRMIDAERDLCVLRDRQARLSADKRERWREYRRERSECHEDNW